MQLAGMLALYRAEVAAADSRPGDVSPALDHAGELAERTGEGNAYWLGFGPSNTGFCRTSVALDLQDYDMAVSAAEGVAPTAAHQSVAPGRLLGVLRPFAGPGAGTSRRRGAGAAPSGADRAAPG